jgi:hypothetical protein
LIREEALALCFANLKGTKDKDLLETARALEYLKNLPEFGSNEKVGRAVGVSGEIVREFLALLRLPEQVQVHLKDRKLGLDQGRKLWQLSRRRPDIVVASAEAMIGMPAVEGRHLVDHLVNHPELSVDEAKKAIVASRSVVQREFHVVALLSEDQYRALEKQSRKVRKSTDELVTSIIRSWLETVGEP